MATMSSPHSNSSTETYTVSGSSSTCEEDEEEMDEKLSEKSIQDRRQFKFMSVKAVDDSESSSVNSPDESKITTAEMAVITKGNLLEIPTNKTIQPSGTVDISSKQNQNPPELSSQTESNTISKAYNQDNSKEASNGVVSDKSATIDISSNSPISEINSESLPCELPPEQVSFKPISTGNSPEASNETISDQFSCTIASNETLLTQSSPAEPTSTPLQNTELKLAPEAAIITTEASTSITAANTAAFQDEVRDSFLSPVQEGTNASVPENNIQKLAEKTTGSSVDNQIAINTNCTTETQLLQQVQIKQSLPVHASEASKTHISSPLQTQKASETSEPNAAQTCTTVPESLDNLVSMPSKNSTVPNVLDDQVIPGGTTTGTPEIPKTVESNVMEKDNSKNGIISKEQKQPSETIGVKSMTRSEVKELESIEVSSDAVPEGKQNPIEGISYEADEPMPVATQFETPRRPAPSIDSRTITRPSKIRAQQLPEATVTPLSETESESTTADMLTANTEQPFPPSHAPLQPPQAQSAIAPRPQIIQQVVPPRSVQQQVVASKPILQQTSAPKITPQLEQQQQPTATAIAMRGVSQPVVVPPNITPSVPVVNTNSTIVSTASAVAQGPPHKEISQREERKSSQRVRQRTVTVQSQVSLDITAAYNEVKQMNSDDPATELVRRVQAIVATREKEWTAKNEKLTQLLAHEQRRNEPLEQKAAERLLAMAEYEKLVQEFVEELKRKNSDEKNCLGESKSVGRPGPERNLSPDDVTQLLKERDQLAEEVNSLETSYSELFRRYEKLRQTSVEIKRNEDSVKSASEEMARRYSLLAEKFEMLRRNAEEQLDLANNEIERLIKQHEADTLGLRLKVKHQESKIDSLTVSLEARQKELESMTAIFEEVITKAEANDASSDV